MKNAKNELKYIIHGLFRKIRAISMEIAIKREKRILSRNATLACQEVTSILGQMVIL